MAACCWALPVTQTQAHGIHVGINIGTPTATVVYPDVAPPAPVVEVQTSAPGPDYTWIGGNWVWNDHHKWTWEKGRWERPPHAGMHYVAHHYEERDGKHVFERGGWRK